MATENEKRTIMLTVSCPEALRPEARADLELALRRLSDFAELLQSDLYAKWGPFGTPEKRCASCPD